MLKDRVLLWGEVVDVPRLGASDGSGFATSSTLLNKLTQDALKLDELELDRLELEELDEEFGK